MMQCPSPDYSKSANIGPKLHAERVKNLPQASSSASAMGASFGLPLGEV
jgi:hypothetical protein